MYNTIFSKSFLFNLFSFENYNYTDNRAGIGSHYFAYMISGNCKIVSDTEIVYVKQGDIFYNPYGCKYQSFWYGEPEIKFISLGFRFMPNFEKKNYAPQVLSHNDEAVKLFYHFTSDKMLQSSDIGVFYTLVGILIPTMKDNATCRTKELVNATKRILFENPFLPVSQLAKRCTVSESMLYAAFKKSSDVTLNELRNQIIIVKATILLVTTDMPVEEISRQLQFSSCSYFRKIFKKHTNMTPREMRKSNNI